jgi:hypothetical protein
MGDRWDVPRVRTASRSHYAFKLGVRHGTVTVIVAACWIFTDVAVVGKLGEAGGSWGQTGRFREVRTSRLTGILVQGSDHAFERSRISLTTLYLTFTT